MKEDKAVKAAEEVIETAVTTGHKEVILVAAGVGAGVLLTVGYFKVKETRAAKKAEKELVEEVNEE